METAIDVGGTAPLEKYSDHVTEKQSLSPSVPGKENPWIRFMTFLGWYPASMPSDEKSLVLRLDLSILIFGCISFFTKYLDQQSLTNAYVSGMKEELDIQGDQLNYITATFWASYCTFMIPACYLFTRYPANLVLPTLELGWGLATLGLAFAQNVSTIYALRFLVGLFECCSFTGTIYVIGSWYKPSEVGRRVALFFIAAPAGTMFAGYLQAAAYTNMNGVHGMAGWRWLFIIDAIITLGIAILGFIVFPDIPSRKRPLFLSPASHALAQDRIRPFSAPPGLKLTRTIFNRVLGRWHFYLFVTLWTLFDQNYQPNGQHSTYCGYYGIHVMAIITGIVADRIGNFWIPSIATLMPVLVGLVLLNVWHVGDSGRLAAFMLQGFSGPISPLTMSWATVTMSHDAEERAVVTASMNAIGQGVTAATQIVQFSASGVPRWIGGFASVLATTVAQILVTFAIVYLSMRDRRRGGGKVRAGPVGDGC